ncbi:MAG: hypothetical protein ACI4T5_03260 [Prevotella sp.]
MENIIASLRKHDITVYRSGRIDISARLAKLLSLQQGDSVNIAKDGDEFYIYVAHRNSTSHGRQYSACVYPSSFGGGSFRLQFKQLAQRFMQLCAYDGMVMRLPAGSPRPTVLSSVSVPLITHKIK